MGARRIVASIASPIVLGACLLTADFDGFVGAPRDGQGAGSDATTEAAPEIAAPIEGGDEAAGDAIVFTESFEGASAAGCSPYQAYQGALKEGLPPRSDARACLVCRTRSGSGSFTIDNLDTPSPEAGARFRGRAWVRAPEGGSASPGVVLYFRVYDDDQNRTELAKVEGRELPIDSTWRQVTLEWTVPRAGGLLNMFALGYGDQGSCFLIDDVTIERLP